jgi:hypothetical protein
MKGLRDVDRRGRGEERGEKMGERERGGGKRVTEGGRKEEREGGRKGGRERER